MNKYTYKPKSYSKGGNNIVRRSAYAAAILLIFLIAVPDAGSFVANLPGLPDMGSLVIQGSSLAASLTIFLLGAIIAPFLK